MSATHINIKLKWRKFSEKHYDGSRSIVIAIAKHYDDLDDKGRAGVMFLPIITTKDKLVDNIWYADFPSSTVTFTKTASQIPKKKAELEAKKLEDNKTKEQNE